MRYTTASALILLAVFTTGCAQDTIALTLTSEPPGARVGYRVVDAAAPDRGRTPWYDLGPSPIDRIVVMHPEWSLPQSLLEFKVERPGYTTTTRTYTPSAILSSERHLRDNVLLEVAPPAGGPTPPAGGTTPPPAR